VGCHEGHRQGVSAVVNENHALSQSPFFLAIAISMKSIAPYGIMRPADRSPAKGFETAKPTCKRHASGMAPVLLINWVF
jgi:hypothetical protein